MNLRAMHEFSEFLVHTPSGCGIHPKTLGNSELYDHGIEFTLQNVNAERSGKRQLQASNVIGLEDSVPGAGSLSGTTAKSVGFNPTGNQDITAQLYAAGAQLVVRSHEEYQSVLARESQPRQRAGDDRDIPRTPQARKVYANPDEYFSDSDARLSDAVAHVGLFDVDGVIFDTEPLVLKAVLETLPKTETGLTLTARQKHEIGERILGASFMTMHASILPQILGTPISEEFVPHASSTLIASYKDVQAIRGAFDSVHLAIRLFGKQGVGIVSNAKPDETIAKFTAAHGIAVNVNHGNVLHPDTLELRNEEEIL